MGLFLRQDNQRSQLQTRVAEELAERMRQRSELTEGEPEPEITKDQHQTRGAGVLITALGVILVLVVIWWLSR